MSSEVPIDYRALAARSPPHLSVEELAILEGEAVAVAAACKLLAAYHVHTGNIETALTYARQGYALVPEAEAAGNIARILLGLRRYSDARDLAAAEGPFDPIDRQLVLTETHWRLGADDLSRDAGCVAMALLDANAAPRARNPEKKPRSEGLNVLSYSLFGDQPRYLDGALRNAVVARHLYPGWRVRFYVDATVPNRSKSLLTNEGAELIEIAPEDPLARFGTCWRFLVEDDSDVALYVVRDCDAVINVKERAAVEEWLISGLTLHVMRDHPCHAALILAGMWGARAGRLGPMRDRLLDFVSDRPEATGDYDFDQQFLRHEVWPLMKDDMLQHDSWFNYHGSQPFRAEFNLPPYRHIGQDDSVALSQGL